MSNTSVTAVLTPVLVDTPVSLTSRNVSSITESVKVPRRATFRPPGPFLNPVVSFLDLVTSVISWPVQLLTQEFHTVGANPVCGSTFNVLEAFARVSA